MNRELGTSDERHAEATPQHAVRQHRGPRRYSPLGQLVLARLREFIREPEAVFWTYGFPVLMVIAMGIAFRERPVEAVRVEIIENGAAAKWALRALADEKQFNARRTSDEEARHRLRTGKTDLVAIVEETSPAESHSAASDADRKNADTNRSVPSGGRHFRYIYDPTRPESVLARNAVENALQRAAGRKDVATADDEQLAEPGSRYIDFLVPGLLGMSLMGGGLWGVGFVTVDMRIRKLLKRFLATPMKKSQFLGGIILSRLSFMIPEVLVLLVFARFAFDVRTQGSILEVVFLIFLGAFTFSGLGLLIASRANTIEAVSGLMNLIMLPMWMFSGIFFSSERFPDSVQPIIKALPLTPLNDMLRAVMLEGQSIAAHVDKIGILLAWGVVTFALALRWFRWT